MATVSLTPNQYQQLIERISELETRMVTLHNHSEAQQEQIRVAEEVIQQLRAAGTPTNPSPPPRTAQKQDTEGGAFKALTRYTGNPSEYHDWAFSVRRVLTRADERFGELLQWISGQIDEIKESDVLEYRRTADQSTTDMDWLDWRCTHCWLSRRLTRHWHPLSHLSKLKSKGSSDGNDWNVKREDITDVEWRFSLSQ